MKTLKRPSLAIKRSLKAWGGNQICMISSSESHKPFWFLTEGQKKIHFEGWAGSTCKKIHYHTLFCHLPYGTVQQTRDFVTKTNFTFNRLIETCNYQVLLRAHTSFNDINSSFMDYARFRFSKLCF